MTYSPSAIPDTIPCSVVGMGSSPTLCRESDEVKRGEKERTNEKEEADFRIQLLKCHVVDPRPRLRLSGTRSWRVGSTWSYLSRVGRVAQLRRPAIFHSCQI